MRALSCFELWIYLMLISGFKNYLARNWRSLAINIVILLIVVVGMRLWQQRDVASGPAPALPGVVWNGQPTLVHFWATWCPVCRAEQSSIDAFAKDYPNTITVVMQSGSNAAVDKFMQEQGIHFAAINDPSGETSAAWGVHAVPASFIVDGAGQIRFVEIGYTTGMGLRLRRWLAQF
jgi:thiol-disulfide isomerase/thioredoxin